LVSKMCLPYGETLAQH